MKRRAYPLLFDLYDHEEGDPLELQEAMWEKTCG